MLYVQRTNPTGHDVEPDACTVDQSYETVHIAKCTCTVPSEGSISSTKDHLYGNSTCTKSNCQKERIREQGQQQFNKWNRMHMHVTMFVCVCVQSLPDRFIMPHTCITSGTCKCTVYLRICHYDEVQVHVCNNASLCTSVSQHERMHACSRAEIVYGNK